MNNENIKSKVAKNTLVQIISKIITTAMGIASLAIMTRYLGVSKFGDYSIIISFISFFAMSADMGLTMISAQTISDPREDEKKSVNNLLSLRLFSAVILLSLAPLVAMLFPYSTEIKIGIIISTLIFLFPALNQVPIALFQKKLKMNKVMISEVASKGVLLLLILAFAKLDLGLMSMLWASVGSALISFLILWFYGNKIVKISLAFDFKFWLKIIKKTWPLTITIILNLIYLKGDILILSLFAKSNEVGIYAASHRAIEVIGTIPYMFAGIMLPIFTANWINKENVFFKKTIQKSFDFMLILAVPLVIGTQFISERVMTMVAGPDFEGSGLPLQILSVSTSILFISCVFSHVIIAIEKQKKAISLYLLTAIISFIMYMLLIPNYSYVGAAIVTIISNIIILIGTMHLVKKHANFKPNLKAFIRILISSSVMAIFMIMVPNEFYQKDLLMFLIIIISTLIYFASLYFFKVISKDDLRIFLSKNKKI